MLRPYINIIHMVDKQKHYSIPDYPADISALTMIVRLIDGLSFRFYWATQGLKEADYNFTPGLKVQSIGELIEHIWGLVNWINFSVSGKKTKKPEDITSMRNSALQILESLRITFYNMNEEALLKIKINRKPFWHLINGPLADALTHTGQINTLRRLAGNPAPRADVFKGKPPFLQKFKK